MSAPAAYAPGGYRHPLAAPALVRDGLATLASDGPPSLAACYELCRRLHAAHGRTYYLSARLLPQARRRHVHALYAFARYADDLVDHVDLRWTSAQRRAALEAWSAEALAAVDRGASRHPVLHALAHTVAELGIRHDDLRAFLRSMALDLTTTRYATYEDLCGYMHGSAAVIGAMMVPALGAPPAAREPAMALGVAFQLSNFLRDVAEDWDRGRSPPVRRDPRRDRGERLPGLPRPRGRAPRATGAHGGRCAAAPSTDAAEG
jgi:15-cis-phytoene synthase